MEEIKEKVKILIVEDEEIVAREIKSIILSLNYEVTSIASNFDEAIQSVNYNSPDIILMDINLRNSLSGIEIAKEINKDKKILIIYISAFSDEEIIKKAAETNPVGYLLKPFNARDLKTALLLALHKNSFQNNNYSDKQTQLVNLNDGYSFDFTTKTLFYENNPIYLSIKEELLLTLLIKNRGSIVPFSKIDFEIWPEQSVSDSALRTLIYRLRTKLNYKLIETIPYKGCKINI